MTDGKEPTQAMPRDGRPGAPDGTNAPPELANGEPAGSDAGGGGAYPRPYARRPKKPTFRGGQSMAAYHGTGRLGEDAVGDRPNRNGVAEEE